MKKILILLFLSFNANAYDLSKSFNQQLEKQIEIDKLDSLVGAIEFTVKDIKPLSQDRGKYYIGVVGDFKYKKEWVKQFEKFIYENPNYKSYIFKTERVYGFAKIKYNDKEVIVKSPNYIRLRTKPDLTYELDFTQEGELQVVFELKDLSEFKEIEVYFKSAEELSREMGIRF